MRTFTTELQGDSPFFLIKTKINLLSKGKLEFISNIDLLRSRHDSDLADP